jgi:hypothetical protein
VRIPAVSDMRVYLLLGMLLIPFSLACPDDATFRHELKKGLYDYIVNPGRATFSIDEITDMLTIYLSTPDVASLDCATTLGSKSGMSADALLEKAGRLYDTTIPRCSDNTEYGSCSVNKPDFCYSGTIKKMCHGPNMYIGDSDDCGCPVLTTCTYNGTCLG